MNNTDDNTNEPIQRRASIRRGRAGGGFSGGSSTRSESLRAPAEEDEVDNGIDPENIHREIIRNAPRRAVLRPAPGLPAPMAQPAPPNAPGSPNPAQRMLEVEQAGDAAYSKEYRLTMLQRLLRRRVPVDQIARQLGVSISTIQKDRVELKARLRQVARELDINEIVGGQMEGYDEIAGMALRVASSDENPVAMRLAAMRTSLAAEADRTRFLNTAGVFDVLRFRAAENGTGLSDVQMLMGRTEDMFARLLADDTDSAPRPARRAARAAPRTGGFSPMTMDDRDASSSAAEVETV